MKKKINVSAAIVVDNGEILIAQRNREKTAGLMWEFPGGKIEDGETIEQSLVREFKEELNMDIKVGKFFKTAEYDYDFGYITLHVYFAKTLSGRNVNLTAHEKIAWIRPRQFNEYDIAAADVIVVRELLERLRNNSLSLS
ncbi:MAG: (deoxy)nucleoside triphosphate pyrophosphohydrolase [Lactobacillaceae bacterium]|jgi:8-oxo-dGTP diphosphatase|nr:(deoxy)nucleoside triphosphate pyrophosphohydrolase [Lactobacillaceae bacterium]